MTGTTLQDFCEYMGEKPAWVDERTDRILKEAYWILLWDNPKFRPHDEMDVRDIDLDQWVEAWRHHGLDESIVIQQGSLINYRNILRRLARMFLQRDPPVTTLESLWMQIETTSLPMDLRLRRSSWQKLLDPLMLPVDTDVRDVPWDRLLDPEVRQEPLLAYYKHHLGLAFERFLAEQDPSPAETVAS